ncbi:hypothetical protein [Mesoflavibacter sp. CH_XMU1404-2]|uniref:hypothetical protein n=1 Tax=Mesoflavibacter sp. CH_XMU1404-2 TaxID=3107766 RepID=UPI003009CC51
MKRILILFFLSFIYNSFGQTREIYLNDDLKNISESEFNENTKELTYNLQFDLDTLIVNVKVLRVKKGKISKQKLDSIKTNLSKSSGKELNESDIIVINYFPGLDRCNSGAGSSFLREKYSRYLRKINKNENVSQFFVYKTIEGTKKYGRKLEWIPDIGNLIEKIFFPIHYNCGSFALIDENGNYYLTKGEYDIEKIIDLIKDKKKTFANNV